MSQVINASVIQTTKKYLLTDSRKVTSPKESIFFAISGLHHDGHAFLQELYQKGVREFVVERPVPASDLKAMPEATIWQVQHSLAALQGLAAEHRRHFSIPVVGITGSNGKTIVKEWLYQLLSKSYHVVRSPKSYNSQLGVPLSVWQMNDTHTLALFEAGVSKPGEMAKLEAVIQPSIGIFTNIGSAHDEGFENRRQKVLEKLTLFKNAWLLIYCKDYPEIDQAIQDDFRVNNPDCQLLGWSRKQPAEVRVSQRILNDTTSVVVNHQFATYQFNIPFTDEASVENALHCIVLMIGLGFSPSAIQDGLNRLRPVSMRLELKEGINGCYLIDDSYNNDLAGLTLALDFLHSQQQRKHKVLILSDILESGMSETELYSYIAQLIKNKGVNQFVGIGETFLKNQSLFTPPAKFYASTEDFLQKLRPTDLWQSVVLVKGARKFQFERIINRLIEKTHGTVLDINLDSISHNLNYFREKIGQDTKIMVMVKAFAYGSGAAEVANLLQFHRADYLAVAYADEGVQLREHGIRTPVMVMNPSAQSFDKMIAHQLDPELYSLRILNEFAEYTYNQNLSSKIHIKLDTGMHRLGFEEHELEALIDVLRQNPNLMVASIFSHLAAADESQFDDFTKLQVERFTRMANQIEEAIGYTPDRHLLNSAGIARFPEARMSMVRLGIGLYGVAVKPEDQAHLQTVGTLKTVISQIKHLTAGETVGYGRRGVVEQDMSIATIAIGYADGYDRRFSGGVGKVLINGQLCPVIGNVCMDMTMVDITNVEAEEGDEVIVFGKNPTIRQLADWIGTIPYEILTGVSERVKRVFYREGN
ncbi:MAG: bifunctional UDP-N-acetylmuramoyl-tripeptide:D-alanyl-D-alanine ligase/alanine racemase [Spirosomataceae bacterium]